MQRLITRTLAGAFRRTLMRRKAAAARRKRIVARLGLADAQSVAELQSQAELALGQAARLREELKR